MYSISLRSFPPPPFLFLFLLFSSRALPREGRGAGKKERAERTWGRKRAEKVPAQENDGEEHEERGRGPRSPPLRYPDTRCRALHHPHFEYVRSYRPHGARERKKREGGRTRGCVRRLLDADATFTGERTSRRGTRGGTDRIGRSSGTAGRRGCSVSKGVSLFRSGSESYITRASERCAI